MKNKNLIYIALVLILATTGCSALGRLAPGGLTPSTPTAAPVPATAAPEPTEAPKPTAVPPTAAPTAVPPTTVAERWIGPGKQVLSLPVKLPLEDGGATFVFAGKFTAIVSGKILSCNEAVKKECVLIVIGREQVSPKDNNTTFELPENSFQVPFGSYTWLENKDGVATAAEILGLKQFMEHIENSMKNNCNGGCGHIEVHVYSADGNILLKKDYRK